MNVDFQIINTALFAKKIGSLFKWILISVMSIPRHYQQYYLSSSYVHLLSEVVLRWNITAEKLFWGTGVEIARLNDLNYRIPISSFKKVISRAIELTHEQGLAFYAGTQLKISSHGLLGFTVAISKDMSDAISTLNQFLSLQSTFHRLDFRVENGWASYNITFDSSIMDFNNPSDIQAYEFSCMFFMTGFVQIIRMFISDFKPILELQCKYPAYFSRFSEILSSTFDEIRYEQAHTRLSAPADFLDKPLSMSDAIMSEKFKLLCQKELDDLSATQELIPRVKQLIYDEVDGLRSIDAVAQKLNLTKRTLQRMLQEKSISFQKIYDDVRKRTALQLMHNPLISKDQIAEKLGYSSISSFNRAQKRWEAE